MFSVSQQKTAELPPNERAMPVIAEIPPTPVAAVASYLDVQGVITSMMKMIILLHIIISTIIIMISELLWHSSLYDVPIPGLPDLGTIYLGDQIVLFVLFRCRGGFGL